MRKFCGNCEAFHDVKEQKITKEYMIKDTMVSGEITVLICEHCGAEVYDKEVEIRNDIILFDAYKKKHHLLTSKDITVMREKYDLSQSTLAKILGFGLKTITRYENGAIQDSTHDNLLKLMMVEENFALLWTINKDKLTQAENKKIAKKFEGKQSVSVKYEMKKPCDFSYKTIIGSNGGFSYDGC